MKTTITHNGIEYDIAPEHYGIKNGIVEFWIEKGVLIPKSGS